MRFILDIADNHADVLTITAVGVKGSITRAATVAIDLNKHNHCGIDENGNAHPGKLEVEP